MKKATKVKEQQETKDKKKKGKEKIEQRIKSDNDTAESNNNNNIEEKNKDKSEENNLPRLKRYMKRTKGRQLPPQGTASLGSYFASIGVEAVDSSLQHKQRTIKE